jgi:hypothetical protein
LRARGELTLRQRRELPEEVWQMEKWITSLMAEAQATTSSMNKHSKCQLCSGRYREHRSDKKFFKFREKWLFYGCNFNGFRQLHFSQGREKWVKNFTGMFFSKTAKKRTASYDKYNSLNSFPDPAHLGTSLGQAWDNDETATIVKVLFV